MCVLRGVVCCALCCLMCVVCRLSLFSIVYWLLRVACCLLFLACWLLCVVCCVLCVRGVLCVDSWVSLFVVCGLGFVV